jgi:hypothetical protein
MDQGAVDGLGPQLLKGKDLKLTKAKKTALASYGTRAGQGLSRRPC